MLIIFYNEMDIGPSSRTFLTPLKRRSLHDCSSLTEILESISSVEESAFLAFLSRTLPMRDEFIELVKHAFLSIKSNPNSQVHVHSLCSWVTYVVF